MRKPETTHSEKQITPVRVLLANGDEFLATFLKRQLLRAGVTDLQIVHSGVEALEQLGGKKFDLLLLDLDLRGVSGLDLLGVIRTDPHLRSLATVVTTGVSRAEVVRKAISLGVSDYLLKPFRESLIRERLRRAVAQAEKRRTERPPGRRGLLVAERDRTFGETVRTALEPEDDVYVVQGLAEWVECFNRCKPDCLIMDPEFFGPRIQFFVETARRSRPTKPPKIILTGNEPRIERLPEFAGVIRRAFEPDTLAQSIRRLLGESPKSQSKVRLFETDLSSAVRQAFGLITGVEAEPAAADRDGEPDLIVAADLTDSGVSVFRVLLAASNEAAVAVTAALAGYEPEEIAEPLWPSGLSEVANIVAGRVQQLAREHVDDLQQAPPRVVDSLNIGPDAVRLAFKWGGRHPLVAALDYCGIEETTTDQPELAKRA